MSLELDRFSLLKAPLQAWDLKQMVREGGFYDDTAERYRDYPHAIKNVARLAMAEGFRSYIIRRNRLAIGTASVIMDAKLQDDEGNTLEGNALDYQLLRGMDAETHHAAGEALVEESCKIEFGRSRQPVTIDVGKFDAATDDAVNRIIVTQPAGSLVNNGLLDFVSPVDTPQIYHEVTEAPIPEAGWGDEPTQVYSAAYLVTKTMFQPIDVRRLDT